MKKNIIISVEIDTEKDIDLITKAITRGLYMGLDSTTYQIAPPAKVKINYIQEI